MLQKKKILAISGSTRADSVNLHILRAIAGMYAQKADFIIFNEIDQLPHFNPDLDKEPFPPAIISLRKKIEDADGILICTPEYVYSLPGSLKNAIEWMVSTTLLTDKPAALITAASSGQKAHEALNLLMRTLYVKLAENGSLLISVPKTKLSADGVITDEATLLAIRELMDSFIELISEN
ncbi:MAG: NADPH-dependent FMN reductase [Bacteroidota bacterium]